MTTNTAAQINEGEQVWDPTNLRDVRPGNRIALKANSWSKDLGLRMDVVDIEFRGAATRVTYRREDASTKTRVITGNGPVYRAAAQAAPQDAAALIVKLRAAGRSAREIAAAAGVHVSTVYRWARGLFRPSAARVAALTAFAA